jgi:hypothetical protein
VTQGLALLEQKQTLLILGMGFCRQGHGHGGTRTTTTWLSMRRARAVVIDKVMCVAAHRSGTEARERLQYYIVRF